jgi:hypothetical protein
VSNSDRALYYKVLKDAGVQFDRHFREYSTEELKMAYDRLTAEDEAAKAARAPESDVEPEPDEPPPPSFFGLPEPHPVEPPAPLSQANPTEMAGERLNSQPEDEPIRTDEMGRVWFQEEIRKPAYPKPRGRRVLTYLETGVQQETVRSGDFIETFEVAGTGAPRVAEVKVTLPSYQVGRYRDPRFPFAVHVYNGQQGFDLFEVQDYYGGAELVPAEAKRVYVENVLCYDIRTTVRAIEAEYRHLQLQGKIAE